MIKINVKHRQVQILKLIERVLNQNRYQELIYSTYKGENDSFDISNLSIRFQIFRRYN